MKTKNSFSVSEILLYYFNIYPKYNLNSNSNKEIYISHKNYIGLFIHKILNLYYTHNNNFNILYFLNSKKNFFNNDDQNKIIIIINKLKTILQNKQWEILFYEKNFFYDDLYGKPDAIYLYNNNESVNFFSSLLLKYFYNIKSTCVNKNIFLDSLNIKNSNDSKNNIILIDWKCSNRNIFLSNNLLSNDYLQNFFYNTLYNRFLIQMNIYKYILEKNQFKVIEMYVCLLNIENSSINFIPIYFLQEEFIKKIINNYIEKNKIFK